MNAKSTASTSATIPSNSGKLRLSMLACRCYVCRCFVYRSRRLLIPKLGVKEGTAKERNQPANLRKSRQRSGSKPAEGRVSDSAVIKDMIREKSDPDGTRTRVPAVKGRCPRPLDDGASGLALEEPQRRPQVNRKINARSQRGQGPAAATSTPALGPSIGQLLKKP